MGYSGTSLNRTPLGQSKMSLIERGVLISGVFKYTNDVFGTEKSVLFMEVSSIQRCPYRGVPLGKHGILGRWKDTRYWGSILGNKRLGTREEFHI